MDAKVERLKQVAQSGDIDAFYTLIQEDVKLLEHIDELPFANTPLHVAAFAGQIPFAMEMMGLKPSFARKLDPNGFSPIHLALQNGHIELLRRLLQLDGNLVRVKGREGLTPLHYVVESGKHLNLLDEFLLLCPNSITDVTVRSETALHIALKHIRLKAFQFLVGWLANNSSENAEFNKTTVLNWKNNEGNSVLHILVSRNQTQVVRHFLCWGKRFLDVNSKNLKGKTAWDMLPGENTEIRDMLSNAGAKPGSSSSLSTFNGYSNLKYQSLPSTFVFNPQHAFCEIRKVTLEKRNMFLVVAVLLVTLSFQAVLTPPGGVWQDNGLCITTKPGSSYHQILPFNKTIGSSNYPKIIYLSRSNTTLACEHKAGTAIAFEDRFFGLFLTSNTVLFLFSILLSVLLIPNVYIKAVFFPLSMYLCLSYIYLVWTTTDDRSVVTKLTFGVGVCFVLIQLLSVSHSASIFAIFLERVRLRGSRIQSWQRIDGKKIANLGAVCICNVCQFLFLFL